MGTDQYRLRSESSEHGVTMPRKLSNKLTPLQVKNAKAGRHADGGGLHLLVKQSGARSWIFRYTKNGRTHDVGLGPAAGPDAISLADARDEAAHIRRKIKTGVDPIEERHRAKAEEIASRAAASRKVTTFREVAEAHIDRQESGWKNRKHRQQWRNTLSTYVYPIIGDLPINEVDTPHVLSILEPIWEQKTTTAKRVRSRIEVILNSATVQRLREGENPATWRNHLAIILPSHSKRQAEHHASLPFRDLPYFFRKLRKKDSSTALALELTILTAARTSEALEAEWAEVDLKHGIWTIPANRMKAGKEHRVPLSPRAIEIFEMLSVAKDKFVFRGRSGGHLSQMTMAMMVRRMHEEELRLGSKGFLDTKQKKPATVHGFRSTFRDWADEQTDYSHEVMEMALAHTIKNKSEAAYRRGDLLEKRKSLMTDWADYCLSDLRLEES